MSQPHAIHRLHQYRRSIATRDYMARGNKKVRCQYCLLAQIHCTCAVRAQVSSNAAFMLLMYDTEVLKPSNSGRLIADLIPDTYGFIWSRTEPDPQMLQLIDDLRYQPYVVFPREYATEHQQVVEQVQILADNKQPLFIILDGSWREAKKMFRKSTYLHDFPVLSFTPEKMAKYAIRKGSRDFQLGTAEVASLVLEAFGESDNAQALDAWFELFIEATKYGRNSIRNESLRPLDELKQRFVDLLERG